MLLLVLLSLPLLPLLLQEMVLLAGLLERDWRACLNETPVSSQNTFDHTGCLHKTRSRCLPTCLRAFEVISGILQSGYPNLDDSVRVQSAIPHALPEGAKAMCSRAQRVGRQ